MEHSFFKDRLSAYFDNELPPQEKQVVEQHLRDCVECRAELTKLRQLEDAVNRHAGLADTDYWEKSAQKIESRLGFEQQTVITPVGRKWSGRGVGWKALAAAASIAVLAYVGINSDKILKREQLEPSQSPSPSVQTIKPSVTDSIPRDVEVNLPPASDHKDKQTTAREKAVSSEQVESKLSAETKEPGLPKSPPVVEPEQIRRRDDINLTQRRSQETAAGSSTKSEPRIITDAVPEQRAAKAPAAPTLPIADSVSSLTEQFVDVAEEESKEVAIAHTDTATIDTTLTVWRRKRDALLAMQKSLPLTDALGDLRKMAAPSALQKTEKSATPLSRAEIEKQLLEAWFNLAKSTTDADERTSSIEQIRQVADNPKSPNRDLAARYLKQLSAK